LASPRPPAEVSAWLIQRAGELQSIMPCQEVQLSWMVNRVLAEDLFANQAIPSFRKAMMDGVAVKWSQDLTSRMQSIWQVATPVLDAGAELTRVGVPVTTGMPMPEVMDCVIPIERLSNVQGQPLLNLLHCDQFRIDAVSATQVLPGQHVSFVGEDVKLGQRLLSKGRLVRPHDLGLLAACGITKAKCYGIPTIAVFVTGNEIVPVGTSLKAGQIHDANGPVLVGLLHRDLDHVRLAENGAIEVEYATDNLDEIRRRLVACTANLILVCGGTSVGAFDYCAEVLQEVGSLNFHGVNLRPGRPVGIGEKGSAMVFLLPGNPVACQFTYDLLVRPALRILQHKSPAWPYAKVHATIDTDVKSKLGRVDFLRVAIARAGDFVAGDDAIENDAEFACAPAGTGQFISQTQPLVVTPIATGRASNLSTISQAIGFALIQESQDEIKAGQALEVFLFD